MEQGGLFCRSYKRMKITPRDYQQQLMDKVLLSFRAKKRRPLVVAATGAGKTVVFSAIASRSASKGNRVLILAHRDTLIKQASAKLRDYDVNHGIIMGGFTPRPGELVQVASVQTLVRRLKGIATAMKAKHEQAYALAMANGKTEEEAVAIGKAAAKRLGYDLIIIDEAHLSAAKSYLEIIEFFSDALVLGFTGSPCRLDNKPLGKESGGIYDDLIQAISIKQLIKRGFLVRPVVYGAAEQLDLSGIKKSMGDYATAELAAVVDKPKITGDAVAMYQKICPGVPAVAWCITVEHAQHVADEFNRNGIKAAMLCGDHDTNYRDKMLKALETGEVQVITFVGILIEGVDQPAIGAIILLRPTMSLASYLQVIGRGLRPYTDANGVKKEVCYVLDHAGLWLRHGFADEERVWELNGEVKKKGKKKDAEPAGDLIQCRGCFAVFSKEMAAEAGQKHIDLAGVARGPCCPGCGKLVEVKVRKLEHVDGVLVEITPELIAEKAKEARKEQGQSQTLEDLKEHAKKMGYSPGWADNVMKARLRKREKKVVQLPPPPPELPPVPTELELATMTLEELQKVGKEQNWPMSWAFEYFHGRDDQQSIAS